MIMEISKFTKKAVGDLGDKRRWNQYKARVKALPKDYRTAVNAFERYLMYFPGGGVPMFEDLVDLFEQSAADHTSIRNIIGEDPVEFIEAFAKNYADESWMQRERKRLTAAIDGITKDAEK